MTKRACNAQVAAEDTNAGDEMVVKEIRGRRRYIAFSVPADLTKSVLINRLTDSGDAPYVVQCDGGLAAVRCAPKEMERTIEIMQAAVPGCESLMASGTLKALRSKVPGLERPAGGKR